MVGDSTDRTIARMLAAGECRKDIARAVNLSVRGVSFRIERFMRLLGLYGSGDSVKLRMMAGKRDFIKRCREAAAQ